MKKIELLNLLTESAIKYREIAMETIKTNNHMNDATGTKIDQRDIDALLVDFINYVGSEQGVDYGLHTNNLSDW